MRMNRRVALVGGATLAFAGRALAQSQGVSQAPANAVAAQRAALGHAVARCALEVPAVAVELLLRLLTPAQARRLMREAGEDQPAITKSGHS